MCVEVCACRGQHSSNAVRPVVASAGLGFRNLHPVPFLGPLSMCVCGARGRPGASGLFRLCFKWTQSCPYLLPTAFIA